VRGRPGGLGQTGRGEGVLLRWWPPSVGAPLGAWGRPSSVPGPGRCDAGAPWPLLQPMTGQLPHSPAAFPLCFIHPAPTLLRTHQIRSRTRQSGVFPATAALSPLGRPQCLQPHTSVAFVGYCCSSFAAVLFLPVCKRAAPRVTFRGGWGKLLNQHFARPAHPQACTGLNNGYRLHHLCGPVLPDCGQSTSSQSPGSSISTPGCSKRSYRARNKQFSIN
jgi:hypothetical protein